jgi:amino acid adenylation domain-containing protein/non-ribosomal peptide synthase protein (TIGR01720 family)
MTEVSERIARLSPEKQALLALRLKKKRAGAGGTEAIARRENLESYPLSFAQQRLWFLAQLEPDSPFYNIPAALRFSGPLDAGALERSLNEIVRRHEVLRATYRTVDGEPVQVVAPELNLSLPIVDLRHLAPPEREREALDLATEEARRPFDLTQGPLVRTRLLRLGEEDHVFLLTVHHIAYDGWSTRVLAREIGALYDAFCRGRPSPLPDLPIQYADYAHWQRRWLQDEVLETQLDYWKQRLGDIPPALELHFDRPRPPVHTYRGAHYTFDLPRDLVERLKALSRQQDTTLFMTMLAAFQVLLCRYTGQEDISIGTPVANRSRVELEDLIGFFVNTLVIRADLSGEPGFGEVLRRVREAALGAYAHPDIPFEMLVDALQPERNMSHTPLFQVMFDLQKAALGSLQLGSLKLDLLETESGTAKFDIVLLLEEEDQGLKGVLEYNTDLFDLPTIRRMAGHWQTLLAGIARDPDRPVSSLPLLTEAERHELLTEWNTTATVYPKDHSVHELFEAQALRRPDRIAVSFPGESLTYGELNRRANQLASYLRQSGVGPDVFVGICVERSLDMVVGILGILKAGGTYVPLDPTYPQERLAFMVADVQAPVVIVQTRLLAYLPEHQAKVILIDRDWEVIAQAQGGGPGESEGNPVSGATAEHVAYLMYTSGSTGRPKGICIPHRAINRLVFNTNYIQMDPDDRVALVSNSAFDAATFELWSALLHGARLVGIAKEVALSPYELAAYIREQGISTMFLTTALFNQLAREIPGAFHTVRHMMFGGEAADPHWVREVLAHDPPQRLLNAYGPTENTTFTTWYLVQEVPADATGVPIGRPISNTQTYVLDRYLQPLPLGIPGELCIGGDGLAREYLRRPELTAEKFIPNPFSDKPGERLYRTGDLVRYRPDGTLEFLGRIDHQVKIRGFRIELTEIEAVLGQHPAVQDAVVLAREDMVVGEKMLVAYVAPKDEGPSMTDEEASVARSGASSLVAGELRSYLQRKLPEYMVPSAFVMLNRLPLTPNGKVDRRALPAPDSSDQELNGNHAAPRTPLEEMLAGIWAQVLGRKQAGIHDNFFDAGGHSLLATQLMSRVRDAFHVELPLRALFEAPTIAGLARAIDQATRAACGLPASPIGRIPRDGDLPLSFAQQRLWFLDHLEPGSPLYSIPAAVRMTGRLDLAAFERSIHEIVRRHEALRTTFVTVDGQARQVIAPELRLSIPVRDLAGLLAEEREAEARRLAAEEARRPFDLAQGPLMRVSLLRLSEEEHVALVTMHHIISDGWSVGVLIHEVAHLYNAFAQGLPSPLPELPIQYADFARWQRAWLTSEVVQPQLDYWREQLGAGSSVLELPTDRSRPAMQSYRGDCRSFTLPVELSTAIRALCRQEGATLFMVLLAAFQTLLHRYSGQGDIRVGTPIANRNRAEIENLIGFFVNTLVLRADLSGNPTFRELLRQVRETALGAYAHQDVPFEMVVDALEPERDLSYSPLFQVMFALQEVPLRALELAGLTISPVDVHSGTAKFDMSLFVDEHGDELRGVLEYNSDLFEAATIERMLNHFTVLLQGIVADPGRSVSDLPLLTPVERRVILEDWNATRSDAALDMGMHRLFEAQARRTPDRIALVFEHQRLAYEELERRANCLAHYLRSLGVGPDVLVGVCLERTPEMVVALLAVLKAGGAYVPLDPHYPKERLAFVMEDAHLSALITTQRLREALPARAVPVVDLDLDAGRISGQSSATPEDEATARNLAYVLFTSGSTGRPKGVAIEHRSAIALIQWASEVFGPDELAGVLASTSISFDLSVFELFLTLSWGGAIILAENAIQLPGLAAAHEVSLVNTVPSAIAEVLRSGEIPGSVATVNLAGEPLAVHLVDQLYGRPTIHRVFDLYGPTEDTTYSTYALRAAGKPATIGRPISNTRVYLVDANFQPVPVGVAGELYIGGDGLARGYLNRPELTAQKFVPNPFSPQPGARLYRTGDLARYMPDGNLEFLGRLDHQVKIRGFRIELGEIEVVLRQHPKVRDLIVVAREDGPGGSSSGVGKRLVAYVVPEREGTTGTSELRNFLKERLPDYMIPSAFVLLDELPLTPNGKVNRLALPAPDQERPELESAYVAPRTPAEKTLAGIWSQVLGIERVGVHDNFFELGGDSILSIQVVARANQAGLRLSPRQLFQHATVVGLAAVAGHGRSVQADQGVVQGPVPLTPIQRWFFEQDLPERNHWNQSVLLEVREPLDRAFLEQAVGRLIEHHDALRLRFRRDQAGWEQVNAGPGGPVPFEWVDLAYLPETYRKKAVERRAAELQTDLDLAKGPLLRVAYFDVGPSRPAQLLILVHHLAVDGVSWRVLLEDLHAAYMQLSRGEPVRLPPKTTSFRYWAERLLEYAQTEPVRQELARWQALAGQETPHLPLDYPAGSGANTEASGRVVRVSLTPEETQALLQEVPAAYGTGINDPLLAALALAVGNWTGAPRLLAALEGHGREDVLGDVNLSRTVGWFTTLYPVTLDLADADGPGEVLKTVKEQLRSVPGRGIGYGLLRYLCQDAEVARAMQALAKPEISFNYLGQFESPSSEPSPFRLAAEFHRQDRSPRGRRPHRLMVSGMVASGRLQMEWSYSEDLHRRETIERVAGDFVEALRVLIAHCRAPEAGGYTPSDFPDVDLSQGDIDLVLAEIDEAV